MRPERLYLTEILEAADAIGRFLAPVASEDFLNDELRQSAVLQKFILIGEAAARLPLAFRNGHTEIAWANAIGLRNIAVHEYFSVDWSIIWLTAQDDIPTLRAEIAKLLEGLPPE